MIRVKNLNKYFGEHQVLQDVNLEVAPGEVVAVIGPSGSGKSTLLRCLNGLESFEQGEIEVDGIALHSLNHTLPSAQDRETIRKVRLKLGMVFQQFNLFPHMTVLENIIEAPMRVLGMGRYQATRTALAFLRRIHLEKKGRARPETLSGGERQRVAIGRALAMKPTAMLFDEPTASLDPQTVGEVLSLIRELVSRDGMTTIIATHEMSFAQEIADRVIVFDQGKVIETGTPRQIFNRPKQARTRIFLERVLRKN